MFSRSSGDRRLPDYADIADGLGLTRPSYVHLRRILLAERERRDAVRAVVEDVVTRVMVGRYVDVYPAQERLRSARAIRWIS